MRAQSNLLNVYWPYLCYAMQCYDALHNTECLKSPTLLTFTHSLCTHQGCVKSCQVHTKYTLRTHHFVKYTSCHLMLACQVIMTDILLIPLLMFLNHGERQYAWKIESPADSCSCFFSSWGPVWYH